MQLFTPLFTSICLLISVLHLHSQIPSLAADIERTIVREGAGGAPMMGNEVECHTVVMDEAGNVISSSRELNLPIYLILGEMQDPFVQQQYAAISGMRRGAVHRLAIPKSYLAHRPQVQQWPGDRIILEIELLNYGPPAPNGAREAQQVLQTQGPGAAVAWLEQNYRNSGWLFREGDINRLGYILLQQGHLPEALRVLQLNAEINPQSCNAHDSLGDIYLKMGDEGMARSHYQRALNIKPNFKPTQEKLAKLQ